jgi:hypothetical protein
MAIAMLAPLNAVFTDQGSVDVNALARELEIDLPTLARVLGKSSQFLRKYPTAPSVQPRALQLADRVNALAHAFGGLKHTIAWLKTPARELGDVSTLDALQVRFDVGISHIDGWVMMLPD